MNNIRDFRLDDARPLAELWLESAQKGHPFLPAAYWQDRKVLVRDVYFPNSATRVCEDGGVLKGFLSLLDGSFIGALFVSPSFWGEGTGSALLRDCQKRRTNLSLAVYRENLRAVGFYQKHGFQIVLEQENEDSGRREYLMSWQQEARP